MKEKAKMKIFFCETCVIKKARENNKIYLQVKFHPVLGNLEKDIGDQPY